MCRDPAVLQSFLFLRFSSILGIYQWYFTPLSPTLTVIESPITNTPLGLINLNVNYLRIKDLFYFNSDFCLIQKLRVS